MKKSRNIKVLAIVALVLVIAGIVIGFAAFSTSLNISSSASVTPNSSSFKVGFYEASNGFDDDTGIIIPSMEGGAFANTIELYRGITSLSGLDATFTEPGESVTYSFYVGNGGEYDAYLRSVNFDNVTGTSSNKVCTAGEGASEGLVTAACDDIVLTVNVHGMSFNTSNTLIYGKTLSKNTFEPIIITIQYLSTGDRADGPFDISFGDISLDYSTVDGSNSITFTIDGITYLAELGMTWEEWIDSSYNTNGATYYAQNVCSGSGNNLGNIRYQAIEEKDYVSSVGGGCK